MTVCAGVSHRLKHAIPNSRHVVGGTTIEAPGPLRLGEVHAELLNCHIGHEEPGTAIVADSPQGPRSEFQQAEGYQYPRYGGGFRWWTRQGMKACFSSACRFLGRSLTS